MPGLFLVENFYNDLQNPAHVVVADSELSDHPAWKVADGRRTWTISGLRTRSERTRG